MGSRTGEERRLIFEYRPIPMSPMSLALLILLALVTFVLGPLASPPELWPLGGVCFLPLLLLLGLIGLNHPSPTRIFDEGIEVSLPLWWRTLGGRSFYPWDDVVNVYPASGIAMPKRASLRDWKSAPIAAISERIAGSIDGLL